VDLFLIQRPAFRGRERTHAGGTHPKRPGDRRFAGAESLEQRGVGSSAVTAGAALLVNVDGGGPALDARRRRAEGLRDGDSDGGRYVGSLSLGRVAYSRDLDMVDARLGVERHCDKGIGAGVAGDSVRVTFVHGAPITDGVPKHEFPDDGIHCDIAIPAQVVRVGPVRRL
jgi:hypothetical protein